MMQNECMHGAYPCDPRRNLCVQDDVGLDQNGLPSEPIWVVTEKGQLVFGRRATHGELMVMRDRGEGPAGAQWHIGHRIHWSLCRDLAWWARGGSWAVGAELDFYRDILAKGGPGGAVGGSRIHGGRKEPNGGTTMARGGVVVAGGHGGALVVAGGRGAPTVGKGASETRGAPAAESDGPEQGELGL